MANFIVRVGEGFYGPFPTHHAAYQWQSFVPHGEQGFGGWEIIELGNPVNQLDVAKRERIKAP